MRFAVSTEKYLLFAVQSTEQRNSVIVLRFAVTAINLELVAVLSEIFSRFAILANPLCTLERKSV